MVVDHHRQIRSCTDGHPGGTNDKTMSRLDDYLQRLKRREVYGKLSFTLKTWNGTDITENGAYLVCDGGYNKWRILQCPLKESSCSDIMLWSKQLEAVRKDVECTFGILKRRFRLFKNALEFHSAAKIQNAMRSAVILHNMLLENDEEFDQWEMQTLHTPYPEESDDEDGFIEDNHESDVSVTVTNGEANAPTDADIIRIVSDGEYGEDAGESGNTGRLQYTVGCDDDEEWLALATKLVAHFKYMFISKSLKWLGNKVVLRKYS